MIRNIGVKFKPLSIFSLPIFSSLVSLVGFEIEYFHHLLGNWPSALKEALFGLIAGFSVLFLMMGGQKIVGAFKSK